MFIPIRWYLEDIVSHDQSEPVTSKTTADCIDANYKIRAWKQVLEFWKPCIIHNSSFVFLLNYKFANFSILKAHFGMRSVMILTNGILLLLLYHEMYKHVENLHSSVKHYFPDDQSMVLQSHTWVKGPGRVQGRPVIVMWWGGWKAHLCGFRCRITTCL